MLNHAILRIAASDRAPNCLVIIETLGYPVTAQESTSYGLSVNASYAAILSATLASMMCRINRRFLSTKASLSARQLSSNTPTA